MTICRPNWCKPSSSAEDKRFFEHPGFDFIRIGRRRVGRPPARPTLSGRQHHHDAGCADLLSLDDRTWQRKLAEAMFSFELEQRFSKQRIFEMYANEVYLGNRGSFGIRRFAEASEAYFGKDLRQLTRAECAFLAGLDPRAKLLFRLRPASRARRPARARVLTQMFENKFITDADVQDAKACR